MDYKRRNFLKKSSVLAASMFLPMQQFTSLAHAAVGSKKLIILTLDGGNDGVNTVIPVEPSQFALYESYRPNIGIPASSILPMGTHGFDQSGMEFGLHPSLSNLVPLMDAGKMAIFPATHSGEAKANRSHFLSHDIYDAGLFDEDIVPGVPGNLDGKGWLGRYLESKYSSAPNNVVAQDFDTGHLGQFKGNVFVLELSDPSNIALGTSQANSDAIWNDIKGVTDPVGDGYANQYAATQSALFDVFIDDVRTNVDFTRPSNAVNTVYPNVGVGRQFKDAADMIIGLPNLEVIHISQSGYDTHNNQVTAADSTVGNHANRLKEMSDSIAAFYEDLGGYDAAYGTSLLQDVIIVTQSEFGRTVKENGNFGTDHGNASSWFAFGESINGGVYGSYPGLEPENLNGGNWLNQTIDYRDIFSELIGFKHLGSADPNSAFPGYTGATTPLNFII